MPVSGTVQPQPACRITSRRLGRAVTGSGTGGITAPFSAFAGPVLFANDSSTNVLSGGTTAVASGTLDYWTVASPASFPSASSTASPPTHFQVADPQNPSEIAWVINVSGTLWTVIRGAEGTVPVAHAPGFSVQQVASAGAYGQIQQLLTLTPQGNTLYPQPALFAPSGLPGAAAASRYAGATVSGAPQSGTYAAGDYVIDQQGREWICTTAGAAAPGNFQLAGLGFGDFHVAAYWAAGNGKVILDAVMASTSSAVLTSNSASFTNADVGKTIIVNVGAAGANQAPLITTISQYNSPTSVTLAANPPATAAGNPAVYGNGDDTAINSTITAAMAFAAANPGRGCRIFFDRRIYCLTGAPTKGSTSGPTYGNALLPIPVSDLTGAQPKINIVLQGSGPGDETNYWEQHAGQPSGTCLFAMSAAPAADGTWGIPSVIGGPTVASGSGFSFTGGFANIRLHIDQIKIAVPYNPGWIGVDARFLAALSGDRYGYQMFAVGVLGGGNGPALNSVPTASWNFNGAAVRFPVMNNNALSDFGSLTAEGVADAVWIADHVSIRRLCCVNNANAIVFDNTNGSGSGLLHGSWIGEAIIEGQTNNLIIVSGSKVSTFPLSIGFLDSENTATPALINDSGILVGTINWYDIGASTVPKISGSTRMKVISLRNPPGLWSSPPAVPGSGTAVAASSLPWRDAGVNIQPNGATITTIAVGTAAALTGITSGFIPMPSGLSPVITYSGGTPAWQWVLY